MEADCMNPEVAADELEPLPVVLRIRAVKSRPITQRWTFRRLVLRAMAPMSVLAATVPLFALILFVFWQLRQPILGEPPLETVQAPARKVEPEPIISEPNISAIAKSVEPTNLPPKPVVTAAPAPIKTATGEVAAATEPHVPAKPTGAAVQQASFSNNEVKAEANAGAAIEAGAVQIRSVYPIHSVLARFRPEPDKVEASPVVPSVAAADESARADETGDGSKHDTETSTAAMTEVESQQNAPARADIAPAHYRVRSSGLPPVADHRLSKQGGLFQGKVKFWTSNRKLTPTTTTSRPAPSTSAKVIRPDSTEGNTTETKAPRLSLFGFGKRTPARREHFDPTVVKISATEKSSIEVSVMANDLEQRNARLDAANLVPAAPTAVGARPAGSAPMNAVE